MKTRKTGRYSEYMGEREYEEVVDMECAGCHCREPVDADLAFECWETSDDPFPIFVCPECGHPTMIPRQVIEGTEAEERKKRP